MSTYTDPITNLLITLEESLQGQGRFPLTEGSGEDVVNVFHHAVATPIFVAPERYPAVQLTTDETENDNGESETRVILIILTDEVNPREGMFLLRELALKLRNHIERYRQSLSTGVTLRGMVNSNPRYGTLDPSDKGGADAAPNIQWMTITFTPTWMED